MSKSARRARLEFDAVKSRSTHSDRSDLGSPIIHWDYGQRALARDGETAQMIHDRLPFLDLFDSTVPRSRRETAFVHRAPRRQ